MKISDDNESKIDEYKEMQRLAIEMEASNRELDKSKRLFADQILQGLGEEIKMHAGDEPTVVVIKKPSLFERIKNFFKR